MLMGPHRGRIQEHTTGFGKGLGLQIFPQTLPDAARLPTPKSHVNRVPVTQLRRQIPPWTACAIEMQQGFQKLPIG